MRDKYFIKKMGEATQHRNVPMDVIHQWQDKLPEKLLSYWEIEGWNNYHDGLFSIVNP